MERLVNMKTLSKAIIEYAEELPEDAVIHADLFLHLGSRAAVSQALSRLVKRGYLLRVRRGFYVRFLDSPYGKYAPPARRVIENIARITGEKVAPHPAAAANSFGLTTQVPLQTVYITTGPSRLLRLGNLSAELRHAPRWQLGFGNRMSGHAIRIAAWEGPEHAADALRELKSKLSASDLQEMASVCSELPPWLAKQVSEFVSNG